MSNQPQKPQQATALWDADVNVILSGVYQQSRNVSPFVSETQQYIKSVNVFQNEDDIPTVKALVAEFNAEATNSLTETHPVLSDGESATLFRLGIFDCDEAFRYIPGFEQRWYRWKEVLQTLLNSCAQYATIKHEEEQNVEEY